MLCCTNCIRRLTALDVALLNGHRDCADFLISCHAPTGGGAYHRAAYTIQAVWRFYRHKVHVHVHAVKSSQNPQPFYH